jgi:hypothetical protein
MTKKVRKTEKNGSEKMVDVTTLDVYQGTGSGKLFLNVKTAKEDKLVGKWFTIKEAFVEPASKFDKEGKLLDEKEDKLHLHFEEIDHLMTLNKTNFDTLVKDFGTESDDWVGEYIKLRINTWPSGTQGVIIRSREDLELEGEKPPTKEALNDKDKIKEAAHKSSAIKNVVSGLTNFGEDITIKNIVRDLKDNKEKNDISQGELDKALVLLK